MQFEFATEGCVTPTDRFRVLHKALRPNNFGKVELELRRSDVAQAQSSGARRVAFGGPPV
jgi:hypothetical protein